MKSGVCPKCESREVHILTNDDSLRALSLRTAAVSQFVCIDCGYLELYVQDPEMLPKIAQATQKISAENMLGLDDSK